MIGPISPVPIPPSAERSSSDSARRATGKSEVEAPKSPADIEAIKQSQLIKKASRLEHGHDVAELSQNWTFLEWYVIEHFLHEKMQMEYISRLHHEKELLEPPPSLKEDLSNYALEIKTMALVGLLHKQSYRILYPKVWNFILDRFDEFDYAQQMAALRAMKGSIGKIDYKAMTKLYWRLIGLEEVSSRSVRHKIQDVLKDIVVEHGVPQKRPLFNLYDVWIQVESVVFNYFYKQEIDDEVELPVMHYHPFFEWKEKLIERVLAVRDRLWGDHLPIIRKPVVILTHASVFLPKPYYRFHGIQVVQSDFRDREAVESILRSMKADGIVYCLLVLPPDGFGLDYGVIPDDIAKRFRYFRHLEFGQYGVGLGVVIQRLIEQLWKNKRLLFLDDWASEMRSVIKTWYLLESVPKASDWVKRELDSMVDIRGDKRLTVHTHDVVMVRLKRRFKYIASFSSLAQAIESLIRHLEAYDLTRLRKITVFSYKDQSERVRDITDMVKARYPKARIQHLSATTFLRETFGPHVSVTVELR